MRLQTGMAQSVPPQHGGRFEGAVAHVTAERPLVAVLEGRVQLQVV